MVGDYTSICPRESFYWSVDASFLYRTECGVGVGE